MSENCHKAMLRVALFAGSFLAVLIPVSFATAEDSSPYLIGHWSLNDKFSDFKPPGFAIKTDNTEFIFLNPTKLTLTLEYAFFATNEATEKTLFCGCDRDTLNPNGRVRYTMLGELQGGFFSRNTNHCPTETDGAMKTIVFTSTDGGKTISSLADALQAGYQIDLFGGIGAIRTESPLLAVPITDATTDEIRLIHAACSGFVNSETSKRR